MRRRGGGVARGSETKETEAEKCGSYLTALSFRLVMPAEYLHVCENEPGDNKQEAAAIVGHQERREGGRGRWESLPRPFLFPVHSGLLNSQIETHYLKAPN